jgi:hypothetical protein
MALYQMPVCWRSRLHHPSSADTNAGADRANRRYYPGEPVIEGHCSIERSTPRGSRCRPPDSHLFPTQTVQVPPGLACVTRRSALGFEAKHAHARGDVFPISRCRRCDELRQQLLVVRAPNDATAVWRCPDCSVSWAPVTFFMALAAARRRTAQVIGFPKPCRCQAGGPFELVQRMSKGHEWTWVCVGCGTGQHAPVSVGVPGRRPPRPHL